MKSKFIGNLGQWLAVVLVSAGIVIEVYYGAHIGFVFLTGGSLAFAIGTKIKYYRGR